MHITRRNTKKLLLYTSLLGLTLSALSGSLGAYFSTQTAYAYSADAFVMEIDTTRASGANTTFVVPTTGGGYDYTIDCDDSGPMSAVSNQTGDYICEYDAPGTYTVAITGEFPQVQFGKYFTSPMDYSENSKQLLDVKQWGAQQWRSMAAAFIYAENMQISATDNPNLQSVTNMSHMFERATNFNSDISDWDTSSVTDMSGLFKDVHEFNQPLNSWDTSSVTNMSKLLEGARKFNQPLNSWDTSSVTNMSGMLFGARSFNQPLNSWDTSSVVDMRQMFQYNSSFNQPLNSWDTSSVVDMRYMFLHASAFNQVLSEWNISSLTNADLMLDYSGLSDQNYEDMLNLWSAQDVQPNVLLGAANKFYCDSTYRDVLTSNPNNWIITGDHDCNTTLPSISSVSPASVPYNYQQGDRNIYLPGSNLYGVSVTIGDIDVEVINEQGDGGGITIQLPLDGNIAPGTYNVTVTNQYGKSDTLSNALTIEEGPSPELGSISPSSAMTGTIASIYIYGNHMEGAVVTIGDIEVEAIGSGEWGYIQVQFEVPDDMTPGSYDVTVTNQYGKSATLSDAFTVRDGPLLDGVSPNAVYADGGIKQVQISGEGIAAEGVQVWFGDIQAEVIYTAEWGAVVNVLTPNNLTEDTVVDVTVVGPNDTFSRLEDSFTFRAIPTREITKVDFSSEDGKKIMTVTGTGFFVDEADAESSFENGLMGQSFVSVNGENYKFCTDGTQFTAEQLIDWGYTSASDSPPCYYLMEGAGNPVLSTTQFRIWLPDSFDITAPGTVVINNSPAFTFNADAAPTPTETTQPLAPVSTTVPVAAALRTATLEVSGGECASIDAPSTQLLAPDTVTAPADTTILGGVSFELTCSEVGGSTTVSLRLGTEYTDTSVLSAYKDLTGNGTLVPADVTFVNRNGATYVEFPLTDGLTNTDSNLVDEDGVADGRIVDPLYIGVANSAVGAPGIAVPPQGQTSADPALLAPGAPNSGFSTARIAEAVKTWAWAIPVIAVGFVAGIVGLRLLRRSH